jgi:hypothetical protein
MTMALPSAVSYAGGAAQNSPPLSRIAIFRSIDPDVPRHRDKRLYA